MGSGARLRSANQAFGRSRANAFLLSAAPPPQVEPCVYVVRVDSSSLGPTAGPVPISDFNCACSTKPGSFAERKLGARFQYVGGTGTLGMGWEDPPHPAVRLRGLTSGAEVSVAVHCARRCPSDPTNEQFWNGYSVNPEAIGCDDFVDQGSTNEDDLPVSDGIFHALYFVEGPGSPWIIGEDAEVEIFFTPDVLPDPGPYSIVSIANKSGNSLFTFDRPVRFSTSWAAYIQGTINYNGMWRGEGWVPANGDPNAIEINVPFAGDETAGTALRVYDRDFDCWYNWAFPTVPPPPLPPPPI